MELNYGPIVLTALIAICDHYWGITLKEPDMHAPDITSMMLICSVIMILLHPTMLVPFSHRVGVFLYMTMGLVVQRLILAYPWTCFNRLLVKLLPDPMILAFSFRMLVSTGILIFAIMYWRHRTENALNEALNEVYMEVLGNGAFLPHMDTVPLSFNKIVQYIINRCTRNGTIGLLLATQDHNQFMYPPMNNTNALVRAGQIPSEFPTIEQINYLLRYAPRHY
ncbi:hypothetical protein AWZ03_014588 [Drosophila navojoa]|uniref:Uncharacterized protein n=1 Tax=Drosophila navojoa TaxID=7232 RepID=A0A484ASZ1_DRONA|nr:hypothetical protein AWZ03_014588 [Drosophila navojoa]